MVVYYFEGNIIPFEHFRSLYFKLREGSGVKLKCLRLYLCDSLQPKINTHSFCEDFLFKSTFKK